MACQDKSVTMAECGGRGNVTEAGLITCVPHLRIFAMSLTRNRDHAEDLVQDTIVRALTAAHQFQADSNLKAWMFTILRNLHCDQYRKKQVPVQSLDDTPGYEPSIQPCQEVRLELGDLQSGLQRLSEKSRNALLLVSADGLTYQEAAELCNCAEGTIKSRVSRARRELQRILDGGSPGSKRPGAPMLAGRMTDTRIANDANHRQAEFGESSRSTLAAVG